VLPRYGAAAAVALALVAGCAYPPPADVDDRCGDGVVDDDERCDGQCPASCADDDPCTIDRLHEGSTCRAWCEHEVIRAKIDGDGCCPAGARVGDDSDCFAPCTGPPARSPALAPQTGAPVGSACTLDSECDSPTAPSCMSDLEPFGFAASGLIGKLAPTRLVFEDGYCSSAVDCVDDDHCGDRGRCYRTFEDVSDSRLRDLEVLGGLDRCVLQNLPDFGACLRPCLDADDCDAGQSCDVPLASAIALVDGRPNPLTFCIAADSY
jgi:hypothetical protein